MSSTIEYTLSKFQDVFINSEERLVSIIGAKGSSKTWSQAKFVLKQIARAVEHDLKEQGLIMLNSRQQVLDVFEQDIRPELENLGWDYYFNAQQLNLRVYNSLIHLRSADPDAVKKIESIAYDWGCGDEVSYWPPETLKTFVSRIRKGPAFIRITSMPDEPDAFMYSFLENLGGVMYEIGLKDNPDREFADRYEKFLRATYEGAQLERFLIGKRVSLTGQGIFPVQTHHRIEIGINPNDDLMLSWDFNVEYRAVSAWQKIGVNEQGHDVVACVYSWQLKNPTVYEDAVWLSEHLSKHKGNIILHGDASGESRNANATKSMWKTIRDVFYENLENVRYIVPRSNPPVKDTIQCLSWALRNDLVFFNEHEKNVFMSLQAVKSDKYGEIDKSIDYKEGSMVRSHEADTARYAIFSYFKHVYPGSKGGFFII